MTGPSFAAFQCSMNASPSEPLYSFVRTREVGGRRAGRVGERLHVLQDVERRQLSLELVDDEVLGPAAAVAADVDDDPLAVVEGPVEAVELGDVLGPHRRQVEVPHLAAGGVLDVREVLRDPAVVAEVELRADRLDLDDAAPLAVGRRADREPHLLPLRDLQVAERVVGGLQVGAVDREEELPVLHVHVGAGERRHEVARQARGAEDRAEDGAAVRVRRRGRRRGGPVKTSGSGAFFGPVSPPPT